MLTTTEQKELFTDDKKVFINGDDVNPTKVIQNLDMFPQIKDWWPGYINPGKLVSSEGLRNKSD
jgi:hypothetical protein